MNDFDASQCVSRDSITPGQWHMLDQNMAAARHWVATMTALQREHIDRAHVDPGECHTPCSSVTVIESIATMTEESAKVILHMLICDAALILSREE